MNYYVYFNHPRNTVLVHEESCKFCNQGLGLQQPTATKRNGAWRGGYGSYGEALMVARTIGRKLGATPLDCHRCRPSDDSVKKPFIPRSSVEMM